MIYTVGHPHALCIQCISMYVCVCTLYTHIHVLIPTRTMNEKEKCLVNSGTVHTHNTLYGRQCTIVSSSAIVDHIHRAFHVHVHL